LNIEEIGLSVLKGQCLDRRIAAMETMRSEAGAWELDRNNRQSKVNWRFTTENARIKLRRLYPKF
jgi:hypothetical protein